MPVMQKHRSGFWELAAIIFSIWMEIILGMQPNAAALSYRFSMIFRRRSPPPLRSCRAGTSFLHGRKGGKDPPKGTLSMGSLWKPSTYDHRGPAPLESPHKPIPFGIESNQNQHSLVLTGYFNTRPLDMPCFFP